MQEEKQEETLYIDIVKIFPQIGKKIIENH